MSSMVRAIYNRSRAASSRLTNEFHDAPTAMVLLGTSLIIIRLAAPAYQIDPGAWLNDPTRRAAVRFAIQLVPFAGIAFLWFIGVLRNRVGALEDQFFATVFLGSGMLFVASLF